MEEVMENKHINQELELQIITTIIANNFTYAKIQGLVKPIIYLTLQKKQKGKIS